LSIADFRPGLVVGLALRFDGGNAMGELVIAV
jgi:hypothetical protein